MAKGDWWIKFDINAWLNDPRRRRLSRANSDSWLTTFLLMELEGTYFLEGSATELANMLHLTADEFSDFIADLKRTKTADVPNRPRKVLIISRRLKKQWEAREYERLKKKKQRVPNVSPKCPDTIVISKKKEVRKEPPNPQAGEGLSERKIRPESEISIWVNAVAVACGAKDARSLKPAVRWRDVCESAIRENRDLGDMLRAVTSERERVGDETQFFTPEGVLKKLQMASGSGRSAVGSRQNGNGAKPQWQVDRDNCSLCDESGYVAIDGKKRPCKHGEE